jgi:hypothetical protein
MRDVSECHAGTTVYLQRINSCTETHQLSGKGLSARELAQ